MSDRHSPLCMCQQCQDEALASELRRMENEMSQQQDQKSGYWRKQYADAMTALRTLSKERDAFQSQAGALKRELFALRARIKNAPTVEVRAYANAFIDETGVPKDWAGKRVALVVLNQDDEAGAG